MRLVDVAVIGVLSLAGLRVPDRPCYAAGSQRPNVVLIIADDMAWDDCGAYGNPKVRTPPIDRLAREGMRFDRAFVTASSCSPSRSSILTGRYPHNTDAEELHWPLPPEQVTFVEKLKASGYWTAAAGKWHLGNAVKDRFDVVREADPSGFRLGTGKDAKARMTAEGSGAAQSGCDQWVPALRDRPRDKPFFLWLAALDPHRDYQPGTIPEPHRPEDVTVPPYLPDLPEVRKGLAPLLRRDQPPGPLRRRGAGGTGPPGGRRGDAGPVPQRQRQAVPPLQDDAVRQWDQDAVPRAVAGPHRSWQPLRKFGQHDRHRPDGAAIGRHRACAELPGQGHLAAVQGPDGEGSGDDLCRAELARLRRPRAGVPVGEVQVHQERGQREPADAPGRCGAEPDFPGDASAPGRRQADPGAAGLLREPPACRGALRRGRRSA